MVKKVPVAVHFEKVLNEKDPPPPPETNPYVSRVNFEHYDIAHDLETLTREFPRGKRIHCDGQQRDQRASTIFSSL